MQGTLPRRALALTLEWASLHRAALLEDWALCERRLTPKRIPPLEQEAGFRGFVTHVRALPGHCLHVRFIDGTQGEVDASRLIFSEHARVFAALRDPVRFAGVRVTDGVVTWPGDLDLAQDAMYDEIRARGRWEIEP